MLWASTSMPVCFQRSFEDGRWGISAPPRWWHWHRGLRMLAQQQSSQERKGCGMEMVSLLCSF